jgi:hypothetical protein
MPRKAPIAAAIISSTRSLSIRRGWEGSSFAQSHVLDGIHDSHFAVLVAILVEIVLIPFNCAGFDDRAVLFAVIIPAKPQDDIRRGPWEFCLKKLIARYFSNIDRHLCLHRRDLHKHE